VINRAASAIVPVTAFIAVVVVALLEPRFLSGENLLNIVRQTSPLAVFAIAQTIPLLTRGLDLSQGGVVVFTSVSVALMSQTLGTPGAFVVGLFVGTFSGLVCGVLVALLRVSPLVVTLGVGSILSGFALVLSNGQPVSEVAIGFSRVYYSEIFHIPGPVLFVTTVAIAFTYLLGFTRLGKNFRAIGSNERAALLSGVPVPQSTVLAYTSCGALTSLGAVLLAARISSGHPTVGSDTALQAIAAAVIGGVSLSGGRGTVAGALLGAVFLGSLSNSLNLLNVSSFSQMVAIGIAIVAAVIVDRLRMLGSNNI
jgi:ribose transport system permease protein